MTPNRQSHNSDSYDPTYFSVHYSDVRLPIATDQQHGLRRGQLGAIHNLSGHFCLKHDPAIVVMPTGSCKTGVLMLTSFLERAQRVLVVTPSQLVRGQVGEQFSTLAILRQIGALPPEIPGPKVKELRHRVATIEEWESLRPFNVIVTTPNTVSPALATVAHPPADMFDLL